MTHENGKMVGHEIVDTCRMRKVRSFTLASRQWLAFSRQGVLGASRRVYASRAMSPARAAVWLLAGSMAIGLGVSLFRHADRGVPPYDVLLSAIDHHTSLSHGQAGWAISVVLFLVAWAFGRRARLAALAFVFANGVTVDAAFSLVAEPTSEVLRWVFVGLGLFFIAFGVAFVVHSGDAGGPFELLTDVATARGASDRVFRTTLEVVIFSIGALAGGAIGPGTLVFALGIGPLLGAILQALADHGAGRDLRRQASTH